MQPEQREAVLHAQLFAVSYLQTHLCVYPAAWIIKNTRSEFIYVYFRERTKYIALKVIAWYLFFTFPFPPMVAYFLLRYDCQEHEYDVIRTEPEMALKEFKARVEGCSLQDFLRNPWNTLVTGPAFFLGAVILGMLLHVMFTRFHRAQRRVMAFAKPMLPRLFYNGLGPSHSDHSSWHIFQKYGLGDHWNFWHDSFGSLDLVLACLALVLATFFGFVITGYLLDKRTGLAGAAAGAAAGVAIARVMLFVLNYALGASGQLISYIDEQLHGYQPYKKVLGSNGIKSHGVSAEVQLAAEIVRSNGKKAMERTGWNGEGVEKLAHDIEIGGYDVVNKVVEWLFNHKQSLFSVQNVCFYLYNTDTTFSHDEYGIASLSMMNIPLFLATYFDPTWSVLGNFVSYNKEKWTPFFKLSTVYIGYPKQFLCKRRTIDGTWKIGHLGSVRELEQMEDVDKFRELSKGCIANAAAEPLLTGERDLVDEWDSGT